MGPFRTPRGKLAADIRKNPRRQFYCYRFMESALWCYGSAANLLDYKTALQSQAKPW
jgi:hypothetical protein